MKLHSDREEKKKVVKNLVRDTVGKLGYEIIKKGSNKRIQNYSQDFLNILSKRNYSEFTMLSMDNLYSLFQAIEYASLNNIPGDIVECGVWRGGAMMFAADTLDFFSDGERSIWLYDTFSGMTEPTKEDVDINGNEAEVTIRSKESTDSYVDWCYADLQDVKNNLEKVNYPIEKIHFIKGDVLETIPKNLPTKIAILRLDTDWYESTEHEMIHLFPLLEKNGILIVDDYGTWAGSKKAVDEYFSNEAIKPLLQRVDHTAVMMIKQ